MMAKYDYGGGCPCGLYSECIPGCVNGGTQMHQAVQEALNMAHKENETLRNVVKINKEKKQMTASKYDDGRKTMDFGFSFDNGEDFIQTSNKKAQEVLDCVMPLLQNLKRNPESDIIKWPGEDRVAKIDELIAKLNRIVGN